MGNGVVRGCNGRRVFEEKAHVGHVRLLGSFAQRLRDLVHEEVADEAGLSPDNAYLADGATVLPSHRIPGTRAAKAVPAGGHHAVFDHLRRNVRGEEKGDRGGLVNMEEVEAGWDGQGRAAYASGMADGIRRERTILFVFSQWSR